MVQNLKYIEGAHTVMTKRRHASQRITAPLSAFSGSLQQPCAMHCRSTSSSSSSSSSWLLAGVWQQTFNAARHN
jgi:hypothetical protein